MGFRVLADLAVVVHFGFLVFLVVGGWASLRWRRLLWLHVATVAWSAGIVTVGQTCPLTVLEVWATERAGGPRLEGGFIDRYVEGVVYPGSMAGLVRVAVALVVVVSWFVVWRSRDHAGRAAGTVLAEAGPSELPAPGGA